MSASNIFQRAHELGLISKPKFPDLPSGSPIVAALCALKLPSGCLPPNGTRCRIASGSGQTATDAGTRAMGEAIELYCLQFMPEMDSHLVPFFDSAETFEGIPSTDVVLGHPHSERPVYSGCSAAWPTIEGAIEKATFEVFERFSWDFMRELCWRAPCVEHIEAIKPTDAWLLKQFRQATLVVTDFSPICEVVVCRLTDLDGGRPTYGSASGIDPTKTALAAINEATLHWFNQVKFEAMGTLPSSFAGKELEAVEQYRGARLPHYWPNDTSKPQSVSSKIYSASKLLSETAQALGVRCRGVDMSEERLGLSVVKIVTS